MMFTSAKRSAVAESSRGEVAGSDAGIRGDVVVGWTTDVWRDAGNSGTACCPVAGASGRDGGGFTIGNVTPGSTESEDDIAVVAVDGPLKGVVPLEKVEISTARRSAQTMLR